MGNYKCQRPIHPGELLKEEVEIENYPKLSLLHKPASHIRY